MKISEAIDNYFQDRRLEFSPKTISNYELFLRYFIEFTEDAEIEAITTKTIRRFLVYLKEERNYSERSIHDAWVALSSLWTWAEAELKIPHAIRGHIKIPKFSSKAVEPFTQTEISKLLEGAEYSTPWRTRTGKLTRSKRPTHKRDVAIILTLLDSGMRNTELRSLCIKDYNPENGRLYIANGKKRKRRFVVVGSRTCEALGCYLASRGSPKPSDPLFITSAGKAIDRGGLRHLLGNIAKLSGVSNVYPHRFRHTFATTFLRNGGDVFVLQELLGHSRLSTVKIYVRIAQADLDAAIKHSVADNWNL